MFGFRTCVNFLRAGINVLRPNLGGNNCVNPVASIFPIRGLGTRYGISPPKASPLVSLPTTSPSLILGNALVNLNLFQGCPSPVAGLNFVRSIVRIHFPRPRETKRLGKHSWKVRMSTPSGRRIIMRRILKGRHSLCH